MKINEIADQLKASVSLKREFKEALSDCMKRDDATEESILTQIELEALLEHNDLSRAQKCQELRWRLHKLRYPKLAEAEQRFQQAKKKLCLPESIHINPSDFFEKKEIKIEIKSRSQKEFKEQINKLKTIQNEIDDLFV